MSEVPTPPAVSEAMREAVARPSLFERLREAAQKEAAAHRLFTDMRHGPHYEAMKPESSLASEAALEITRLRTALEAAETRFSDIAAGRAFQPRPHAATGAAEARAALMETPDA